MKDFLEQLYCEGRAVVADFVWHYFRPRPRCGITTWQQFWRRIAAPADVRLLSRLDEFPNAVLVAGCQRSGTTLLARIIGAGEGMAFARHDRDDELLHALILVGAEPFEINARCCFQTTYLNAYYHEYLEHGNFQLVWLIRKPLSVVYSMVYRWRRWGLNDLYLACGKPFLNSNPDVRELVALPPDRLTKACLAYCGKLQQLFELHTRLDNDQLLVTDYDRLVADPAAELTRIYDFIRVPFRAEYAQEIHQQSRDLGRRLPPKCQEYVQRVCRSSYEHAFDLINN